LSSLMFQHPPKPTPFPYTTLFRSKLNGMANPANNYGFEVTAVSGAGLTVRDPTAQLLSEGPTASAAVERHVSMAARGFGDKAGNNTCDPTQDPDASGTTWCRSDVLLVKLQ